MPGTAVVTMIYNEPIFAPLWIKYYGSEFGQGNCYIVDHGSDDGSIQNLGGINILKIPRSPMDDRKRAEFLSQFCSSLLCWYDSVIYTDVDEFLVADPNTYGSLKEFCDRTECSTVTAVGLNVIHNYDDEPVYNSSLPILNQRNWVRFSLAMCKPLFTRSPIKWVPGFHYSDQPMIYDNLFLFHLHHFDRQHSLERLSKTRSMPWEGGAAGQHQRWSDQQYDEMLRAIIACRKISDCSFGADDQYISERMTSITDYVANNPSTANRFYVDTKIKCDDLLKIPNRFLDIF